MLLWGIITGSLCFAVVVGLADLFACGDRRGTLLSRLRDRAPAGCRFEPQRRDYTPLVIFSVGHWTGGTANILIAFVSGAILTAFYLGRKDLVANMIGHFLVDFVANVLPRLADA